MMEKSTLYSKTLDIALKGCVTNIERDFSFS